MPNEKKKIEGETDELEGDEVHLEETCEIELPQIDVSKYIGKKTKIELVTEHQGQFGYFVKVQSAIIETITGRAKPIELRASRIFGLQENDENQVGWGKATKLGLFLKKMHVNHYKDLVGKDIVIQSMTNKDGREFLTFN